MRFPAAVLCATGMFGAASFAATTATWEMSGYNDFFRGKLTGMSLNRDGRLALAPKLESVFGTDQPEIWSMARAADGTLYLGTGHRGRIYKVDRAGKGSLYWTADQAEIFALAVDPNGVVYAGTSPDGKIYRIENGKASEYFAPGAKYIWSLRIAADGALFAGTGDQGRIYRVTGAGQGEVYYESGQSHITCLAIDSEGRLLAGSEPNGILYRVSAKNKAFVLFDSSLPEIRSILAGPNGVIYATALGGSLSKKSGAQGIVSGFSGGGMVTAPGTSITVTDSQAGGIDLKPKSDAKPVVSSGLSAVQPGAQAYEVSGVEKSAIYRIQPDNTVETIWSSKDENVYDLVSADGVLLFSTDGQGRVYRLNPDRKATLIVQTNEGETSRLVASPEGIFATAGASGKLYRLAPTLADKGEYESPVHDAGTIARWGRLHWRADRPAGTRLEFRTRSGNSSRPDNTWSDWSEPLGDLNNSLIKSPNARYIQWKAALTPFGAESPMIYSVTAAYLPQNHPPVVRSVLVTSAAPKASGAAPATGNSAANSSFSITVTDSGEAPAAAGTSMTALSRASGSQTQITWQAEDPEGDRLIYSLYFRGEDEKEWKLLRGNFFENSLLLDGDVLADGRYFFRVTASDRPANPLQYAKESEGISAPVLIDNTPPSVAVVMMKREGPKLEIDIDASDQTSMLRRCEYSLDAGTWTPIEASDGVTDSSRERFELRLDNLRAGEHIVVIRVYDQAGNAGLTKAIIR